MVLFIGLVSGVLVINAALDLYFVDQTPPSVDQVQKEKAEVAAQASSPSCATSSARSDGWHIRSSSLPNSALLEYNRMQLLVSHHRVGPARPCRPRAAQGVADRFELIASNHDRSRTPAFVEAVKNKVYFSPSISGVESEPYSHHGSGAIRRGGGVTVADANLKFILDPISQIKVGVGRLRLRRRRLKPTDRRSRHLARAARQT